jgi:hypothetical protein
MERGDEALKVGGTSNAVVANTAVIARLDWATQYAVTPVINENVGITGYPPSRV